MRNKLRLTLLCVVVSLLMGCGGGSSSGFDTNVSGGIVPAGNAMSSFGSAGIGSASNVTATDSYESNHKYESNNETQTDVTIDTSKIQKEMLVYNGSVELTTKQYDEAINALQMMFYEYDCFIEDSREYTTSRNNDEEPLRRYHATVRISSKDYDTMMNGVSKLGVISDKQSTVENLSVEYSDITTALRIYRAREERYLKLLEQCENEEDAIIIEDKLTEIAVIIAQYELRKSIIETDVAYSTIEITIEEVKEYAAQIKHTDGFFTRLGKEFINTFLGFIYFLEELVLFFVRISPYVLLIWLVVLIIKKTHIGKWIKQLWNKF